jgi:hypothetical protein
MNSFSRRTIQTYLLARFISVLTAWGPGIRCFLRRTGLELRAELRWESEERELGSEEEDRFNMGEFG